MSDDSDDRSADGADEVDGSPDRTDGSVGDTVDRDADDDTPAGRGREVVVPLEVYKVVTVFSTLFAVGAIVVGFVLLDWGTDRAQADPGDVNLALVIAGLVAIAAGALTYAFSTRFRTGGMGTSKEEADGAGDDG